MTRKLRKDSQISSYMAYPRSLLTVDLSETEKLIYVLLLDRARLSIKNEGWVDENGDVFVYYTIDELAKVSRKCKMTVKNSLTKLEKQKLICRKRQGAGLPNIIYVQIQTENCPAEGTTLGTQTDKKPTPSKKMSKGKKLIRTYDCEEDESL